VSAEAVGDYISQWREKSTHPKPINVRRSMLICERIEDSDMEEGSVNSKKKELAGDRRSRMKKILPTLDFNFDRQGTTLLLNRDFHTQQCSNNYIVMSSILQ
jgi:hypothetical protein